VRHGKQIILKVMDFAVEPRDLHASRLVNGQNPAKKLSPVKSVTARSPFKAACAGKWREKGSDKKMSEYKTKTDHG
jgi:hypothetical protein